MAIPDDLVNAVRAGECILFLGAMASVASPAGSTYQYRNAPPSGNQLSKHLATVSGYPDRKSTRLNSSHLVISYAVFCLKKKNHNHNHTHYPPQPQLHQPNQNQPQPTRSLMPFFLMIRRPPRSTLFPYTDALPI